MNAFHAVVGTPLPADDPFTQIPERRDTRRTVRSLVTDLDTSDALHRKASLSEKVEHGQGADVITPVPAPPRRNGSSDWDDLSAWISGDESVQLPEQPPAAVIKDKDRTQPGMMSRDNSSIGTSSQTENPFAVPSSIPLSRQSSASESPPQPSSFEAARRNKSLLALRRSRKASRKSYKRPVMSRASSTYSNLSVGSDMSRMSSMASNILTDQEKFASLALKERRRKLLEADLRA